MKKIILWFIGILLIVLILIIYMVNSNKSYNNRLEDMIIENTDVSIVNYINLYDEYYIVLDDEYLYLFSNSFNLIYKKDINLIHENINKYDIIYKDETLMYFDDYIKDNILFYEYYDINTYELIDRVLVGGEYNE